MGGMRALRPTLPWLLAAALAGCATAAPAPEKPQQAPDAGAAPTAQAAAELPLGPLIPFKFQPEVQKPWGLRVARHRTLPAPPGSDGAALHFDSEEDSRLWTVREPDGNYVLEEVLAGHNETKNGDPDEDPVLVALTGVKVGMRISPEGKFVSAVDPDKVVKDIAGHWPGGQSGFERLPPEVFAKELERDWRLGAQVYFERPVHVNEAVYSLLSVSLPQLPSKYVAVAERFGAPRARPDGASEVSSTQELFGRGDPRWMAARQQLAPLMQALQIGDDEVLVDFKGQGGETIGLTSMQVYASNYEGEGIFPLEVHGRGSFPLRFQVEEVAGSIAPPPVPTDPRHTAARAAHDGSVARR